MSTTLSNYERLAMRSCDGRIAGNTNRSAQPMRKNRTIVTFPNRLFRIRTALMNALTAAGPAGRAIVAAQR